MKANLYVENVSTKTQNRWKRLRTSKKRKKQNTENQKNTKYQNIG